jgi:hypothetical protein
VTKERNYVYARLCIIDLKHNSAEEYEGSRSVRNIIAYRYGWEAQNVMDLEH